MNGATNNSTPTITVSQSCQRFHVPDIVQILLEYAQTSHAAGARRAPAGPASHPNIRQCPAVCWDPPQVLTQFQTAAVPHKFPLPAFRNMKARRAGAMTSEITT